MLEHAVHTLVVDICSRGSEETALDRMELFRNTSALYGQIITQTLEESMMPTSRIKIEKLQIDLGTLSVSELQSTAVLKRISQLLKKQLAESFKEQSFAPDDNDEHAARNPDEVKEIMQSFLLRGDLPWWLNTSTYPDMDVVLLNTIRKYPDWLHHMLETNWNNQAMKRRIVSQFKPATRDEIGWLLRAYSNEDTATTLQLPIPEMANKISSVGKDGVLKFLRKVSPAFSLRKRQRSNSSPAMRNQNYFHLAFNFSSELPHVVTQQLYPDREKAMKYMLSKLGRNRSFFKDALTTMQQQEFEALHHSFQVIDEWYTLKKSLETELITTPTILENNMFQIQGMKRYSRLVPPAVLKAYTKSVTHPQPKITSQQRTKDKAKHLAAVLSWLPIASLELLQDFINESLSPPADVVEAESKKFIVENAGLCLVSAYLPALFNELNYLKNGLFKSRTKACRAVYLLEYIATGRQRNPEYVLPLNKLLCGLPPISPMPAQKRLSKKEKTESTALLQAIIRNWKALGNTSINGLRGAFICRKGFVTRIPDGCKLQVEQKGMDVLLESIPWNYTTIKHAWMNQMITVEW
jgi:hypothetical protein